MNTINKRIYECLAVVGLMISLSACVPDLVVNKIETNSLPDSFGDSQDTTNAAQLVWKKYFNDPYLVALIDSALLNNQELNITIQEVQILQNEVMARKGEYLPSLGLGAVLGLDKVGRYTRNGALEAYNDIKPNMEFPEPLADFTFGAYATWEVDVWRKLRNAKKSAYLRYLSSVDGQNFMVTNLIGEIANSYFELLALDTELDILKKNIAIQEDAYKIVVLQKQSARVTELAVRRFEAQLLRTKSLQFDIQQEIIEAENRINLLVGRAPQPIARDSETFTKSIPGLVNVGLPSQLLDNRPDIKEAERQLEASKIDVKVAKAQFYPSIGLSAGVGYQAFSTTDLLKTPESLLFNIGGDVLAPLINRKEIKSRYYNANAKQLQAIYNYERTVLTAVIEVTNQISNIENLKSKYDLKEGEVKALNASIDISNELFRSARADYMEVLMTQRDALESRFELIETKMEQMRASVDVYRVLGGGWQ